MSAPQVVKRNGTVNGLPHPIAEGAGSIRLAVTPELAFGETDRMRQVQLELLERYAPGISDKLEGPAFEALATDKLEGMAAYWKKRSEQEGRELPLQNERMPSVDIILPSEDGGATLFARPDRGLRYNHVMAIREVLTNELGPVKLAAILDRLAWQSAQGSAATLPTTPFVQSTSLGVNVVRIAESASGPAALFTIQGTAISFADASGKDSKGLVGSTGGAVCIDKTSAARGEVDLLTEASRELSEETAIGLIDGDKAVNVAGITQMDLQFALFQLVDHRESSNLWAPRIQKAAFQASVGLESPLSVAEGRAGQFYRAVASALELSSGRPTIEFFESVRGFAPDAAEAQRYLPVPVTKEAFLYVGASTSLNFAPWTNVMLSELGAREFGPEFRSELAAATENVATMTEASREARKLMPTEHRQALDTAMGGQSLA